MPSSLRFLLRPVSQRLCKSLTLCWLTGVRARNTPATLERYRNTTRLFLRQLGPKAQRPISILTAAYFEGFLNARLKMGCAPKTAIVDLKTLKIAFRRAENYGIIPKSPVGAVRIPKEDCSERAVFTQDEIQKLVNAAPSLTADADPSWLLFGRSFAGLCADEVGERSSGQRGDQLCPTENRKGRCGPDALPLTKKEGSLPF